MGKRRTALITGASSGIGLEMARLMAAQGIDLVLVARSAEVLGVLGRELEANHRVRVVVLPADLARPQSPGDIWAEVERRQIAMDYLVNNAGFGDFGRFAECDWEKNAQMIQVNITALAHLTRLFLPGMVARGEGRVLNVASTAAFQAGPLMSVYYATKAFVVSFSEAVANELSGTGVTVTALCPGPTHSGFHEAAGILDSRLLRHRRLPTSRDVAEFGYRAMMRGRTLAVHGLLNAGLAFLVRFLPRKVTATLVRAYQDTRPVSSPLK